MENAELKTGFQKQGKHTAERHAGRTKKNRITLTVLILFTKTHTNMTNLFEVADELTSLIVEAQSFPEETTTKEWDAWIEDFAKAEGAEKEKIEAMVFLVKKYERFEEEAKEAKKQMEKKEKMHKRKSERVKASLSYYMSLVKKKKYETAKFKIRHQMTTGRLEMTKEARERRRISHNLPAAEKALDSAKEFFKKKNAELLKKGRDGQDLPDGIKVVREERLYIY